LRLGWWPAALLAALLPLWLMVPRRWSVRLVQFVFVLATCEWFRTLALLLAARRASGMPYLRLTAILAAVILLTAAAVPALGSWWRLGQANLSEAR